MTTSIAPPTFDMHTCGCVSRHIDEAVLLFDRSEKLLAQAQALAVTDDQACEHLRLLTSAAKLRLTGIQEVRAAHRVMHLLPCALGATETG